MSNNKVVSTITIGLLTESTSELDPIKSGKHNVVQSFSLAFPINVTFILARCRFNLFPLSHLTTAVRHKFRTYTHSPHNLDKKTELGVLSVLRPTYLKHKNSFP